MCQSKLFPARANVFCANRFLCSEFFFLVKTVTEISGSQFLKKDHILTYVTGFLASGNHFFPFSSDTSQLLSVEVVYSSTEAYFSANPSFRLVKSSFFVYWKQDCFIVRFFLLAETMIEMRGKSIFKEEPLNTNFFRNLLK